MNSVEDDSPACINSRIACFGSWDFCFGPRNWRFFSRVFVKKLLTNVVLPFLMWKYPITAIRRDPKVFMIKSCIVSKRFFCSPDFVMVSSVNSKISQRAAVESAKVNIIILAKSGFAFIRFFL